MLHLYSHAEFVYPCCASNFTEEGQRRKAASSILPPKRRSVDPVGSSLLFSQVVMLDCVKTFCIVLAGLVVEFPPVTCVA
jgi:hypothetical protein